MNQINIFLGLGLGALDCSFVNDLVEESSEETAQEWATDVGWAINDLSLWGIWEDRLVGKLLEEGLEKTNDWVDASSRNSARQRDGEVERDSDAQGVDWHLIGSIMLDNHEYHRDEGEGGHGLADNNLSEEVAAVVASTAWAQLSDVVSILSDFLGITLLLE